MKEPLLICLLLLSVSIIFSQKVNEEKKNSINEVYKRLNLTANKNRFFPSKGDGDEEEYKDYEESDGYNYDPDKIKEVIALYEFPETYNFFEAENAQPLIKDQADCGSCWAFSSSSALAYRYFKKTGKVINLSPQYLLSCSGLTCEDGGYILDTQYMLVNKGTVTNECMPYTSADGVTIEECPSECPTEGVEFIKYKTKNAYATSFELENNYYDVVAVIMDQLVNYGPVVTGLLVYDDFSDLIYNPNCPNIIYRHENLSQEPSGHAVVIVGYGYRESDNKYYWIIQNSWGEVFCDHGFVNIEFGQINVENVAFSEPYIEADEDTEEKEIDVTLTINEDCFITYTSEDDNYENSFEVDFVGEYDSNFHYQCNKAPSIYEDEYKGLCSFDFYTINNAPIGNYEYDTYTPLHVNNEFHIRFSGERQFYYYGYYDIYGIMTDRIYVSEMGSRILLAYDPPIGAEDPPAIYPNENTDDSLKYCDIIYFAGQYGILCELDEDELNYFNNEETNSPLAYDLLCGKRENMDVSIHQLDKTKYPVIRVTQFILPSSDIKKLNKFNNIFTIIADIEGSVSGITEDNHFTIFIQVKRGVHYNDMSIYCEIPNEIKITNDFEIKCILEDEDFLSQNDYYNYYDDVFLLPYYSPEYYSEPFEVIINEKLKAVKYKVFMSDKFIEESNDSYFIKFSLSLILLSFIFIYF